MSGLRTVAGRRLADLAALISDHDRLARGRRYQRKGAVDGFEVAPGDATTSVRGSRPEPYRVTVAVRLANENVRRGVAEGDLGAAVPVAGEVALTCVCPDWGDPCKHGVAALLELARAVDDDASVLLRWRGIEDVVAPPPPGTESLAASAAARESGSDVASVASFDPDDELAARRVGRVARTRRQRRIAVDQDEVVGDRLAAVHRLRRGLRDQLADPSDLEPRERDRPGEATEEAYGGLRSFFVGSMPVDGSSPVQPLNEPPLAVYREVRIMLENYDAAPVIADAIDTIADHWQFR